MSKFEVVLFDYDGTLRDTRELIYAALDHAFTSHQLPSPTSEQLAPHIHHHTHVHQEFASGIPFESFEIAYMTKVEELLPSVKLYPGVAQTLQQLRDQGYRLGLVTAAISAPEDTKRLGIDDYFETIVSGNDIAKHKPDPEGVNLALQRLGVQPEQAIMIGDLATDLQAAQAAGLRATIGITHGFGSRESLDAAGADYVIDSLDQLNGVIAQL